MKILCAPDKFKGSISAVDAAEAMRRGVLRAGVGATVELLPVADGGEGTLAVLRAAKPDAWIEHEHIAPDPLGRPTPCRVLLSRDGSTAIVELAQASGLQLLAAADRNPLNTSTFGAGTLVRFALERGAKNIVLAVGGSATVDGGVGLLQGLGARVHGDDEREMDWPVTGGLVERIRQIDPPHDRNREIEQCSITVLCDVRNPLLGPHGAAEVYGPQKGATPLAVRILERGLTQLASLAPHVDPQQAHMGAAGGVAFGLAAWCGATLVEGAGYVLERVRFTERCRDAALVLTGEGRIDAQSLEGKAVMAVAREAAKLGVPSVAIVGDTGEGALSCLGDLHSGRLSAIHSLTEKYGALDAMKHTGWCIELLAEAIVKERMASTVP